MRLDKLMMLGTICLACAVPLSALAESPAELLEKGIYQEETTGNLDEAIKIYRAVVSEAEKTQAIAAQAQYRLGLCLLKQGKKDEAAAAFRDVVEHFADQTEVVAKAREHLPSAVEWAPAPWESGERLTLSMRLAGGLPIGIVGLGVDEGEVGEKAVWKMTARRFVTGGQNQGTSQMVIDRSTNRPLAEVWQHSLLGDCNATWSDNAIVITAAAKGDTPEKTTTVTYDAPAYSNDQMFFAFRQLPLAVGYKATIPLRVTFTGGNGVDLTVDVSKKEIIETPSGTFECFKLETNILQTFWIADVPQRYLVRFEAQGVIADLTSIGKSEPTIIKDDSLGLSLTVPAGWFYYHSSPPSRKDIEGVVMVAPELISASLRVQNTSQLNENARQSPRAWAEREIEQAKDIYKNVQSRPEGVQNTTLAGAPAAVYTLDHEVNGQPEFYTAVLAIKGEKAIDLNLSGSLSQAEASREAFASIREALTIN
jgi:hypothetical protein